MISRTATKAVEYLRSNPRCRIIALSASEQRARALAALVRSQIALLPTNECHSVTSRRFIPAFLGSRTLGLRSELLLLDEDFDYEAQTTKAQQKLVSWIRCSLFSRLTKHSEIGDDYSSISAQALYELTKMPVLSYPDDALGPELRRLILLLRCFPKSQP